MTLRLALDQNFPLPLLRAIRPWLPREVVLEHLTEIDTRLSAVTDRQLFIALHQLGWDGLVTNNWRMLNVDREIAAIVRTKAIVVATKAMGDDPIRPAGALLLELPELSKRLKPQQSNIFLLKYAHRQPESGWDYLEKAASRHGQTPQALWLAHRPSDSEMATPVLT